VLSKGRKRKDTKRLRDAEKKKRGDENDQGMI